MLKHTELRRNVGVVVVPVVVVVSCSREIGDLEVFPAARRPLLLALPLSTPCNLKSCDIRNQEETVGEVERVK
jgi:hypothetical protein